METQQQQPQQSTSRDIHARKDESEVKQEQPLTTQQQQQQQQQPIMRREEESLASGVPVGEQVRAGDVKSKEELSRQHEQSQLAKDQPEYQREQPAGIKGMEHGREQPSSQVKETEFGRGTGGGVLSELTPSQQAEHKQSLSRGESGGVSHSHASVLRVYDAAGGVVMPLNDEDVNKNNVGWLRHQLHNKRPEIRLGSGEPDISEMHIFTHYGDWLGDEVTLKSIKGDRLYVKCYRPHGDISFNLNFKVVPSIQPDQVLTVSVKDAYTIEQVKDRITEVTRVPAINQRILFCDKELEDWRTVTDYKLPAEATCELRLAATA